MNSVLHTLKRALGLLIFFTLSAFAHQSQAQFIRYELTKEFLEAEELYVIQWNSERDLGKLSRVEVEGFLELVKENFPEKKVIPIEEKIYNNIRGARKKFFIAPVTFHQYRQYDLLGSTDCLILQKGRVKTNPYRTVYWLPLDLKGINEGVARERLAYGVRNLAQLLRNYNDKSERDRLFYKTEGFEEHMGQNTLYVREENLDHRFTSLEAIKEYYPYPVQIVSQKEWEQAIGEKKDKVLFIDKIGRGRYTAINIYRADNGKLVFAGYPWIGTDYKLGKTFFKKAF